MSGPASLAAERAEATLSEERFKLAQDRITLKSLESESDEVRNEVRAKTEALERLGEKLEGVAVELSHRRKVIDKLRALYKEESSGKLTVKNVRTVSESMLEEALSPSVLQPLRDFRVRMARKRQHTVKVTTGSGMVTVHNTLRGRHARFKLSKRTTMASLLANALYFWRMPPARGEGSFYVLVDASGSVWPEDSIAVEELSRGAGVSDLFIVEKRRASLSAIKEFKVRVGGDDDDDDARGARSLFRYDYVLTNKMLLLRDMFIFLLFCILFLSVLFARRNVNDANLIVQAMRSELVQRRFGDSDELRFHDIRSPRQFWAWTHGPLRDTVFAREFYNFDLIPDMPRYRDIIGMYSLRMGSVRFRQLRTRGDSCTLSTSSKADTLFDGCYGLYSRSARSTDAFGPSTNSSDNAPGFTFAVPSGQQAASPLQGRFQIENDLVLENFWMDGELASYDGSGFTVDFNSSLPLYDEGLAFLRNNRWIDEQTRAVFVSLNAYNPNYNFYIIVNMLVELSPSGQMVTSSKFRTLRLDLYESPWERLWGAMDILVFSLVLYFVYIQRRYYVVARDVLKNKPLYFKSVWTFVELSIIGLYIASMSLRLWVFLNPRRTSASLGSDNFVVLADLAALYDQAFAIDGLITILLFFKLFKYFKLARRMNILVLTLTTAGSMLLYAMGVFLIFLYAFVVMAFQIFGAELFEFNSMVRAQKSLLLMMLGQFNYDDMALVSPTWAPLFFTLFTVIMYFVMVNLFLAIVNHSFGYVRRNDLAGEGISMRTFVLEIIPGLEYLWPEPDDYADDEEEAETDTTPTLLSKDATVAETGWGDDDDDGPPGAAVHAAP